MIAFFFKFTLPDVPFKSTNFIVCIKEAELSKCAKKVWHNFSMPGFKPTKDGFWNTFHVVVAVKATKAPSHADNWFWPGVESSWVLVIFEQNTPKKTIFEFEKNI